MKKQFLILALMSLTAYATTYAMSAPEMEQDVDENKDEDRAVRAARAAHKRNPFFVHFNFQENIIEVSHSTLQRASPRSLFQNAQTISCLTINPFTGDIISVQAFTRSFNRRTQKTGLEEIDIDATVLEALKSKAGQALNTARTKNYWVYNN